MIRMLVPICFATLAIDLAAAELAMPDPVEVSRRISEQFLSTRPDAYEPVGMRGHTYVYGNKEHIHYSVCSLWVNALECARLSGLTNLESRLVGLYRRYAAERADVWKNCDYLHVDFEVTGAVPLEVGILTGDSEAGNRGLYYADRQWREPLVEDVQPPKKELPYETRLEWWRKGYSPETRLWIDDMYMISLLQLQAYRYTGDRIYLERATREMSLYLERLPTKDGLYFHAPTAPFVWARGNGWMAGAMPMILAEMPLNHPERPKLMKAYRDIVEALRRHQRPSGLWGQLVDDAESWDETSGSAMYAFAFAEGLRMGWLDESYREPMVRAYCALVSRLDEHANLLDVCIGTGARNDRSWYLARRKVTGDPHGQAPLLWLCASLIKARK